MSKESRFLAGVLLVVYPTVALGGASVLSLLVFTQEYAANPLRQDLWRAGHAHAGVYLLLALVMLRYVDEANLSDTWKWFVRLSAPIAAIILPAAFFLSVLPPDTTKPNALIYLAYAGGTILATGLFVLGIGLVKKAKPLVL
jgi:drug/metabolite transporter superfamily protein YnfA